VLAPGAGAGGSPLPSVGERGELYMVLVAVLARAQSTRPGGVESP
jgi:hypothetical protein